MSTEQPKPFHVLISGAGVGGLMLATLLDKAGIDFSIYERAKSVKPLGTSTIILFFSLATLLYSHTRLALVIRTTTIPCLSFSLQYNILTICPILLPS
jgi:hypothetical protein